MKPMKPLCFPIVAAIAASFSPAQQPPPAAAPEVPAKQAAAPTPSPDAPEDEIENHLQKSAEYYEKKQRAKAGGLLLEAAEIVETLAAGKTRSVADEVESLRHLALQASRGQLDARAVDFAAARAYVKLASICYARHSASWTAGKPKDAGREWFRAIAFLERSVDWGGYGLRDAGEDTLAHSKDLAAGLAKGQPVDADEARKAADRTSRMITEVGRALAAKAGVEWLPAPVNDDPPATAAQPSSAGDFVETESNKVMKKVRQGAGKLGELLKRFSGDDK